MSQQNLERELSTILLEQIDVEKDTLQKLAESQKGAKETVVHLIFKEMEYDTAKHVQFLESIIKMLETTPCDQWSAKVQRYAGRVKLKRDLESFIEQESRMIVLLEQALEKIDDPLARFLLYTLKRMKSPTMLT
jgi:hypothetical protein